MSFVHFILSFVSSIANKEILRWKYDGKDWMCSKNQRVMHTNRYQIQCDWLFEDNSRFFEKFYSPKKSDVVIDVGAGLGVDLYRWSMNVRDGIVYAIECDSESFRRLSKTVALSNLKNVELVRIALSDSEQIVQLAKASGTGHKNFIVTTNNDVHAKGFALENVEATTLDNFVSRQGIKIIDFLKLNIEGFEVQALMGADLALKITRNIVVSCHDFLGEGFQTYNNVKSLLKSAGFDLKAFPKPQNELEKFYVFGSKPR